MVAQFTPVAPGWKVLFTEEGKADIWLPLLGWLTDDAGIQPCVWWSGLAPAETAADELGMLQWSVVERGFRA
jgi:hypothetical protein